MDKYTYLLLGLAILVPLAGVLLARKDLAIKAAEFSVCGGVAGMASEFFYLKDYWRPPSLFGTATVSFEDFLFGFAITGLSFTVYLGLFRARLTRQMYPFRRRLYLMFFIGGFAAMLLFNLYLGMNSIFVSSGVFLALAAVMLTMRHDLIRVGFYSAAVVTVFMGVVYVLLFDIISPHFWDSFWLLKDTKWGVTILGNVPLTEMLWYVSWTVFASVSYPFVSGRAVQPNGEHT